MVYGSASGCPRRLCRDAPATESNAPTSTAISRRGRPWAITIPVATAAAAVQTVLGIRVLPRETDRRRQVQQECLIRDQTPGREGVQAANQVHGQTAGVSLIGDR